MRRYSLTDLNNRSGEVVEAAHSGPVEITRHGKPKFVILTADDYARLLRKDPRQVFGQGETPEAIAGLFAERIDALAKGEGYDDEP